MKHELSTLFTFKGKIYTAEALSKIIGKDVTSLRHREKLDLGCKGFLRICEYNKPSKASFTYYTTEGAKIGWQFGEKTYFDTEVERDNAREEYKLEREKKKHRTELLEKLKALSTEELEKIVNNLK